MLALAASAVLVATMAAACSSGRSAHAIRVVYMRSTGPSRLMDNFLAGVKTQFEKANPGTKVQLVPLQASEDDYYTKIQLMMRSPRTAPDVVYEDSSLVSSDAAAGYLRPLDDRVADWPDWKQFTPAAQQAGRSAMDQKLYGVPVSTDTIGLWYNKQLLAKAGIPVPWQPKTWDDVLAAARAVKTHEPGVRPLFVRSGKSEAASFQGLEMLLYGTGGSLYDTSQKKWTLGGAGLTDSLDFVRTVYHDGLGASPQEGLDPNVGASVTNEWLPEGKLAIDLDGSWIASTWAASGAKPWPQWSSTLGLAAMPTQHGQAPGKVSMSGGWTWALTSKGANPDAAWRLVQSLESKASLLTFTVQNSKVPVRTDVAADPAYRNSSPVAGFFSSLLDVTHYRPGVSTYPQVSTLLQTAMESVTDGSTSAADAARACESGARSVS